MLLFRHLVLCLTSSFVNLSLNKLLWTFVTFEHAHTLLNYLCSFGTCSLALDRKLWNIKNMQNWFPHTSRTVQCQGPTNISCGKKNKNLNKSNGSEFEQSKRNNLQRFWSDALWRSKRYPFTVFNISSTKKVNFFSKSSFRIIMQSSTCAGSLFYFLLEIIILTFFHSFFFYFFKKQANK